MSQCHNSQGRVATSNYPSGVRGVERDGCPNSQEEGSEVKMLHAQSKEYVNYGYQNRGGMCAYIA